ncbi:MAG: hypothetical protein LBH28_00145 [Oscillospiraceae bacterium]|jgi:TRAP-type C4-dicarboxylate transport system substrate-binding protein|nr:hypothetical protein [Oscillospiraceae bacterium]
MKKTLSIALAFLMIAVLLAGCGGDNANTSSSPPASNGSSAPPSNSGTGLPTGVPTLKADAAARATEAYAFIADLKEKASAYDRNAAQYRYTLNCQDPAESAAGEFCNAWSDAVLIATEGKVNIEVGTSNAFCAGGTMVALDDTKAGLIDFVWTLPCYYDGYMPLTLAIQNPSLGIKNATVGIFAMWELYKGSPAIQAEIAQHGEAMFIYANNPSPLSYKGSKELSDKSEITGNIRGNKGPAQLFINEIGAAIYGCPIGEVYPNVQNGVIDYLITDWHAIASFKLADPGVLNYYLDTNVGCSAYALIANADTWSRIKNAGFGDAVKSVSGDFCLNIIGIWEAYEAKGRDDAVKSGGTIYAPNAALAADLSAAYESVANQWVAANGSDARATYDKAVELVNKYNGIYG